MRGQDLLKLPFVGVEVPELEVETRSPPQDSEGASLRIEAKHFCLDVNWCWVYNHVKTHYPGFPHRAAAS